MSDELDLDAIEARARAATPGPWHHGRRATSSVLTPAHRVSAPNALILAYVDAERPNSESDFEFFTAAREDVPALCAEVRRLREELAECHASGELLLAEVEEGTYNK